MKKIAGMWDIYITRVLKKVHPNKLINSTAKSIMNDIISYISEKLCIITVLIAKYANKKTISDGEVRVAVRLLLPNELSEFALSKGFQAVKGFTTSPTKDAGLTIPVSCVEKDLRNVDQKLQINAEAPVFLAAVLEYLTIEILEVAGNVATDSKKIRISVRHIYMSYVYDEELSELLMNIVMKESGVKPKIHPELLPKLKSSKKGGDKKTTLKYNIRGITKTALQRIGYRAGVKSMSGLVYEELRDILIGFLKRKIKDAVIFTVHNKRITLSDDDLKNGNKSKALLNYHGIDQVIGGVVKKKKRRSKPGTVSLRNIRQQQSKVDLILPNAPFQRLVREVGQDLKQNLRYSAPFFSAIQTMAENYLIKVLEDSNLVAIQSGRLTVMPRDIQLVVRLRLERV